MTASVERESFFVVRLIVIPLVLIVMLSWSVFWMEKSSLGDRIGTSFIGILTAVSYQIVTSEIQPQISYFTLFHGFLNLSLFLMSTTVVINLGWLGDQIAGHVGSGEQFGLSVVYSPEENRGWMALNEMTS